jgi:hypothetical protein
MTTFISRHAKERAAQRFRLEGSELKREANQAYNRGQKLEDLPEDRFYLKKEMARLAKKTPTTTNQFVLFHNEKIWIFKNKTLITIIKPNAKSTKETCNEKTYSGTPLKSTNQPVTFLSGATCTSGIKAKIGTFLSGRSGVLFQLKSMMKNLLRGGTNQSE